MRSLALSVVIMSTLFAATAGADTVFVRWEKGGSKYTIAAIDLTTRSVLWEIAPCKEPTFARKTSVGALVACEDSGIMMLDAGTGKELWRRDLAGPQEVRRKKEVEIDRFHGETSDGFLVSASDEIYLLVGKNGEYLMRCDLRCDPSPQAEREALMKREIK